MIYKLQHHTLQQSGIERSLQIIERNCPDIGVEMRKITQAAFHDYDTNDAWTHSLLNRTGAPLEYSFNTLSDDLRYTVEVGNSQIHPKTKLYHLEELLDQIEFSWIESEVEPYMQKIQQGADLEWGTWLGIRHGKEKDEKVRTEFKKYTEIPKKYGKTVHFLLDKYLPLFFKSMQNFAIPVILGNKLGSQRCEFYFELHNANLTVSDINRLLACVGLDHRSMILVKLIKSFNFRRELENPEYLPKAQWAFSYSVLEGSSQPVFSLYAMTTDLLGGDGLVRRQFIINTAVREWSTGLYSELSKPISHWGLRSGYHNMISFVISEVDCGLHLSMSPPPKQP